MQYTVHDIMFVCMVVQCHNFTGTSVLVFTGILVSTRILLNNVNLQHCVSNLLLEYRCLKLKVKYPWTHQLIWENSTMKLCCTQCIVHNLHTSLT